MTKLNDALRIFWYHTKGQSRCYSDTKSGWWATPPSLWNLRSKWPTPFEQRRLRPISAYNVSTVRDSEKVQLWRIQSRPRAFQRAMDGVRMLPLSPETVAQSNPSIYNLASNWLPTWNRWSSSRGLSAIAELHVFTGRITSKKQLIVYIRKCFARSSQPTVYKTKLSTSWTLSIKTAIEMMNLDSYWTYCQKWDKAVWVCFCLVCCLVWSCIGSWKCQSIAASSGIDQRSSKVSEGPWFNSNLGATLYPPLPSP